MVSILITVLPLTKTQLQTNYTPVSDLKEETSKEGIRVYGLNELSPEIIWQFGDKIPYIKNSEGVLKLPEDVQIGLLSNNISKDDLMVLEASYSIEKRTTFDLNTSEPGSKKHNERLTSDYFLLTKR
jgi:hypothetical protein